MIMNNLVFLSDSKRKNDMVPHRLSSIIFGENGDTFHNFMVIPAESRKHAEEIMKEHGLIDNQSSESQRDCDGKAYYRAAELIFWDEANRYALVRRTGHLNI